MKWGVSLEAAITIGITVPQQAKRDLFLRITRSDEGYGKEGRHEVRARVEVQDSKDMQGTSNGINIDTGFEGSDREQAAKGKRRKQEARVYAEAAHRAKIQH